MKSLEDMAREAAGEIAWLKSEDFHSRSPEWLRQRLALTADLIGELAGSAALVRAQALDEAAEVCRVKAYSHKNTAMLGPEMNSAACCDAILALKDRP